LKGEPHLGRGFAIMDGVEKGRGREGNFSSGVYDAQKNRRDDIYGAGLSC